MSATPSVITFQQNEIQKMQSDPSTLRALADIWEIDLTMADAADFPITAQLARKAALLAEADRIEKEWEA